MYTRWLVKFDAWRMSDEGVSALEYAILVGVIVVVVVAAVGLFGDAITALFNRIIGKVNAVAPTGS